VEVQLKGFGIGCRLEVVVQDVRSRQHESAADSDQSRAEHDADNSQR